MATSHRRRRQFGVFEVDLDSGELRRQGVRLRLQEQPLQILIALLERPGEVVTRDALRQRVWPSGVTLDFDHGLNSAIRKLRLVLGDSAASPRFIETLPKHGYRFLQPVVDLADPLPPGGTLSLGPPPDTDATHTRDWRRVVGAIATGLIATGALVAAIYVERGYRLHVEIVAPQPPAYAQHFRGRTLLLNYTEANLRAAIDTFEQALRIDPGDALARSGLATSLAWFSVRYAREFEAADWGRRAYAEARLALAHAPRLAHAHVARAYAGVTVYGGPDWSLVLAEAETALRLDPTVALAHAARAEAFYHLGLFDLADVELRAALGLDPESNVETERVQLATALLRGHFVRASDAAARLRLRTDAPVVPMYLGAALFYLGKRDSAEDLLSSIRREEEPDVRSQATLAGVLAANGKRAEASRLVARVMSGRYMDHHAAYGVGAALAQLGRTEEAVQWLRRSADEGFPCYPWFESDTLLTPIREAPAFSVLLEDLRTRFDLARRRYSSPSAN